MSELERDREFFGIFALWRTLSRIFSHDISGAGHYRENIRLSLKVSLCAIVFLDTLVLRSVRQCLRRQNYLTAYTKNFVAVIMPTKLEKAIPIESN